MLLGAIFYFTFLIFGEVTSAPLGPVDSVARPSTDVCRELRPGESLRVDQPLRTQSATGLPRTYRITRDAADPQLFIAEFNLRFGPLGDAVNERFGSQLAGIDQSEKYALAPFADEMRAAFIARTRHCFESMRDRLRMPNGQRLELRLDYPTLQDPHAPPESTIRIQSAQGRSSSVSWARTIDCNTIVHEVLHLTGLCDGYTERWLTEQRPHPEGGDATRYSCRSIEPEDSIMRDQSGLGFTYEILRCTHSARTPAPVASTPANPLPTVCPDGSAPKKMIMGRREYAAMVASENRRRLTGTTKLGQPRAPMFYYYRDMPAPTSTLYPAQMRLITQPFCNSANQRYLDCAQNAYRTRETEGCAVVPDYCQSTDYLQ